MSVPWRDEPGYFQNAYEISDPGGAELLLLACEATDRAAELRQQIEHDGPVLHTKNGIKAHPALRDELANRAFVSRALARLELGYDTTPARTGRPGGRASGWTGRS